MSDVVEKLLSVYCRGSAQAGSLGPIAQAMVEMDQLRNKVKELEREKNRGLWSVQAKPEATDTL